jgi:hypothetical protein
MTLGTYQFQFRGVPFGAGTPYIVESIDGLGTPALRVQDDNRGYIDGAYSGRDFYEGRTVTFNMVIIGDGTKSAQVYYHDFRYAITPQVQGLYPDPYQGSQPSDTTLNLFQFQLNSESYPDTTMTGVKRMWGRVRNITTPIDPDYTFGYIAIQVEFYFPDPRYYDDTAKTPPTGTSVDLANNGWAATCPAITIASPNASGAIWDTVTGSRMNFANVDTTKSLVIDLLQRTITQGGNPARNTLAYFDNVTSGNPVQGWLSMAADYDSTWSSTLGSMAITYRNAYI